MNLAVVCGTNPVVSISTKDKGDQPASIHSFQEDFKIEDMVFE